MSDENSRKRLGRGLAALIGDMDEPTAAKPASELAKSSIFTDRFVPIENVQRNPNNPRRDFDEVDLDNLAQSIEDHGVVQPILVRPVAEGEAGRFEIIAGERRWRAAQKAGFHQIPVVVRTVDDRQALELAIIENVQRADLSPIEEAAGYQQLMDEHAYTQHDLAQTIGKSRSHVANIVRLLKLPQSVQQLIGSRELSSGHARALITLDAPEELARRIVREGLSVRETERLVAREDDNGSQRSAEPKHSKKSADTIDLEKRLSDHLGLKVVIDHKENDGGKLTVSYRSLDQLDNLAQRLVRPGTA
ncbi:MAG: ParB/RepB/Spo0J family partition protein [Rhizobiaceae bacterium]